MRVAGGGTNIVASGYSGEFMDQCLFLIVSMSSLRSVFAYLFCGKKVGPCRGSDGEDEWWQKK